MSKKFEHEGVWYKAVPELRINTCTGCHMLAGCDQDVLDKNNVLCSTRNQILKQCKPPKYKREAVDTKFYTFVCQSSCANECVLTTSSKYPPTHCVYFNKCTWVRQ